ncbi:MAG: hypothetical protein M1819_004177 [Sarea resinae]|nr:MAG: hypothetical protein M1819_004177 [Sarea resinae]
MGPGTDPFGAPSSFSARRSAASNLPSFELPPPPLGKYPSFASVSTTQVSPINGEGLSPMSSGINSGSSASTQGVPPYAPGGIWAPPAQSTAAYGLSASSAPTYNSIGSLNPLLSQRGMYSPSLLRNHNHSPTTADTLPPPPYDLSLPPFPTSISMSAPSSAPAFPGQQAMANALMSGHTSSSGNTQSSPISTSESYQMQRPQTASSYYSSSSASQQAYPSYPAHSPSHQSQSSRISPSSGQPPMLQPSPHQHLQHFSRPLGGYSLPAMGAPVMSNLHQPGNQMALMGNMHGSLISSYNAAHSGMPQLYGGHHQPQQPITDRPFKCDQCPQSFNRNHDLKRHKRIHLAVKPFPCGHCDKSFSRKDALKRHILVKGCGKAQSSEKSERSLSPPDGHDLAASDRSDTSPILNGHSRNGEM